MTLISRYFVTYRDKPQKPTTMNSTEMMNIIMDGDWRNKKTEEVCSFSWTDSEHSISLVYKSGDKAGQSDSHQFVKLYHDAYYLKNCNHLCYQSNLFTSEFTLDSKNGPLLVESNVFGKMKLIR